MYSVESWTVIDVVNWLKESGFKEYVTNFQKNDIDGELLLQLDLAKLKDIGIESLGQRVTLLKKIQTLQQTTSENSSFDLKDAPLVPSDQITLIRNENFKIGEGNFSVVYKATYAQKEIVAKELKDSKKQEFFQEAVIALKLNHPCIIHCYGYTELNGRLYLLFEFAKHGSLDKYVKQNSLQNHELLNLSVQLIDALIFLHQQGIIHRGTILKQKT